jgi:phosphoribosylaminoimidazole-succinocarboxamide synthase
MENNYQKIEMIYQGKAKVLYSTNDPNLIIQYFKDDATAFNAQKKAVIQGKGKLNNLISEKIMTELNHQQIQTHFVKRIDDREQLVKKVKIIPLEVIIRNFSAGSLSKRLGIEEGLTLEQPAFEICYKNDALQDPLINDDHALYVLKIVNQDQLNQIKTTALKINKILKKIFIEIDIKLIDFKIEFGLDQNQNIVLADEISPDSCRLWDVNTNNKFDKDIFRRDLGNLVDAYQEIANRLKINTN